MLILLFSMLFLPMDANEPSNPVPNFESLLNSGDWEELRPFLENESKTRVNLQPLLKEKGLLSSSQVLFSIRKWFARYKVLSVEQSEIRSDTNYSQIEMTVRFQIQRKTDGLVINGSFLVMFNFRKERAILSKWMLTDFTT